MLFVFDTVWGRNLTVQIHCNVDDGCACVYVRSLNVWNGVVMFLDKQDVRLYWCALNLKKVLFVFDAV